MKKLLTFVLIILFSLGAVPVHACMFDMSPSVETKLENSKIVFMGVVDRCEGRQEDSILYFKVRKIWKGAPVKQYKWSINAINTCAQIFKGDKFMIYAKELNKDGFLEIIPTGRCESEGYVKQVSAGFEAWYYYAYSIYTEIKSGAPTILIFQYLFFPPPEKDVLGEPIYIFD